MSRRTPIVALFLGAIGIAIVAGQTPPTVSSKPTGANRTSKWAPPRTPDGQPDLQGIWNSGTVTPMERPADLAGKEFFTEQEALAWEHRVVERVYDGVLFIEEAPAEIIAQETAAGRVFWKRVDQVYNDSWWDSDVKVVRTRRTSIVTDPADGHIPPLTPAAKQALDLRKEILRRPPRGPEDLPPNERCLQFSTSGPPMTPYVYNNNYQIVQTKDWIAIHVEMIHDTRMIALDGRPHLPASVRLWAGDSTGRWDRDTLVVDTTNFSDKTSFRGSDTNLHVIERFRRTDPNTILYQFTVDDPTAFTKPWSGELTLAADPGPIYEYACHEGNYPMMVNILGGVPAGGGAR